MISKNDIQRFKTLVSSINEPVLSVYCNVNPAIPENAGRAWYDRLKNTLKSMNELNIKLKKGKSFYEELIIFLDQIRTEARTLVLFAWINEKGELAVEHFELQVDLPVVDLRSGRVEAHFGKPYLTPILYAFDEFRRVGVLHIYGSKWRFYEVFMNEVKEVTDVFAAISPNEWKEFNEYSQIIESGISGDKMFNAKIKFKDKIKAKQQTFSHKLYVTLAQMLEKSIHEFEMDRLILMGNDWQIRLFENYLSHPLRRLIVGCASNPANPENPSAKDILDRISPIMREAEEQEEMQLINEAQGPKGVYGLQNVLEALQMGQLQVLILPWDLNVSVYRCSDGIIFSTPEEAKDYDDSFEEIPLKKEIFYLAAKYATRLEFVNNVPKEKLYKELEGIAGILRW